MTRATVSPLAIVLAQSLVERQQDAFRHVPHTAPVRRFLRESRLGLHELAESRRVPEALALAAQREEDARRERDDRERLETFAMCARLQLADETEREERRLAEQWEAEEHAAFCEGERRKLERDDAPAGDESTPEGATE